MMGAPVVIGAGAIGCWLAVRFSHAGDEEVVLFAREDRVKELCEGGVHLELLPGVDPEQNKRVLQGGKGLRIESDPRMLPEDALVFFAVRAYQTEQTARALADAGLVPKGVVTLQNGLGNAEALARVYGDDRVVAGTTSHGVTRMSPTGVRHTGWGEVTLGPWTNKAQDVADEAAVRLQQAGLEVQSVTDPRPVLWRKVAVNAAINPPTAIHGVENGTLLDGGALERDLRQAAREVACVARFEGVALSDDEAEESAVRVARRTARNRSSMLQALEAGRELETDAITGEVVKRAARHAVAVPVNERHLERLRSLAPRVSPV